LWPTLIPQRIEWVWSNYQRQLARLAWLNDDALPHLDCSSGTEIFAESFGCRVERPADDMPFARPLISSAGQVARLRVPSLDHPALAAQFAIADELRRRDPTALLRLPDIQSPMDIAALIWDKTDFYLALLESPAAVRELAGKVQQLLTAFLDEWFGRYGRAFIAHYPDYYMPWGVTLSEDEVGCVDPATFESLFLPELASLAQRYGALGMHCCANARHQWAGFLRIPNLRLLNLVQPPEVIRDAYRFFAPHVAQWHSQSFAGDPATWPDQIVPCARVVLETTVQSRAEAIALAERWSAACAGAP
jgi:hypothetical protein